MQKYIQNQEKFILPYLITPPVFVFLWCFLCIFMSAGIMAWLGWIPVYVAGSGVVLDLGSSATNRSDEAVAIIFVPYSPSLHLQSGQPVQVQLGLTGPHLASVIGAIGPKILSPNEVRQRYQLAITDPSLVITVALGSHLSGHFYAGSLVLAQIQVGSRRLLSLFPGLSAFLKDP